MPEMAMSRNKQEMGGFKLLEEDPLDERACPVLKKFVTTVLNRKDMKDRDVVSSYRNLMEYRDSNSSRTSCNVNMSSSRDRPNSPTSPPSPIAAAGPMDDQRLPNELLDELCEDIGMKEGMDLDFVEYLMEQDTNPHLYMTQEAISSGGFTSAARTSISTPTGSVSNSSNSGSASGSHVSNNSDSIKTLTALRTPATTTTPNFLFKPNFTNSEWIHQLPPTTLNTSHSSGSTTVQSSENNSPANKRQHLSTSTDTSPTKGRSQTPPGFNQRVNNCNNANNLELFKMPQSGILMPKRSHSYPQGAPTSTPVQSTSSSSSSSQGSNTSSYTGFSKPQQFAANLPSSPCQPSDTSDQEDQSSCTSNRSKCHSTSPQPGLTSAPSCDYKSGVTSVPAYNRPGVTSDPYCDENIKSGQLLHSRSQGHSSVLPEHAGKHPPPLIFSARFTQPHSHQLHPNSQQPLRLPHQPQPYQPHPHQPHPQQTHFQQPHLQLPHPQHLHPQQSQLQQPHPQQPHLQQPHPQQPHLQQPHLQQPHMQHQRWTTQISTRGPAKFFNKGMPPSGHLHSQFQQVHHHANMGHGGSTDPHQATVSTSADSPLDQGYFSNESAGNCSNGSAPSPAFTSSSMSSASSITTILPADHNIKLPTPPPSSSSSLASSSGSIMTNSCPTSHKSVHFADLPIGSPPSATPGCGLGLISGLPAASDCVFEMENNELPKVMPSGKILPRFAHGMKSDLAPYTVPTSQGQIMGPGSYMVPSSQGQNVGQGPYLVPISQGQIVGQHPNPGYDFRTSSEHCRQEHMSMSCHVDSPTSYFMTGSQDSMDSMPGYSSGPPPLVSPQTGDYVGMQSEPFHHSLNQFSSVQQQISQPVSHPVSSADSMTHLAPHSHLQQTHHHEPHQNHQFSSCSYPSQKPTPDLSLSHQSGMQINHDIRPGSYHLQLGSKAGSNPRIGGSDSGKMCLPAYEDFYGQPGMYPSQQPYGPQSAYQSMKSNQQPTSGRNFDDLQIQVGDIQGSFSPMKGGIRVNHPQALPHMQPSPTPACTAPMGPGLHIKELSVMDSGIHTTSVMGPPHTHMGPHPEYGPCLGLTCDACKIVQTGNSTPHHPGQCSIAGCQMCKINQPCSRPPLTAARPHIGLCTGPGCASCKMNQATRPQSLSAKQIFIQNLIMDEKNSAFRSHLLFPLLRDLVIAEMNFDNPLFHCQQLLSTLPNDFNKLLHNYLHRNPRSRHYQSDQLVESVIMDSLRTAHSSLVDKIRHRQEVENMKTNRSVSLRSMEEFCHKFDHTVTGPMGRPGVNGSIGHPIAGYHEGSFVQNGVVHVFRAMKDVPDEFCEVTLGIGSPQPNKTESKKHPSLPKEAVATMMEWLRSHKDNPYPNDDEKAMLIKQTGLSINQINYWFTNARRRILPKWAKPAT